MTHREITDGLLKKLGVAEPGKLSDERAGAKLANRLKTGIDKLDTRDLGDEERGLVEGLGFTIPAETEAPAGTEAEPAEPKVKKGKKKMATKASDKTGPKNGKSDKPAKTSGKVKGENKEPKEPSGSRQKNGGAELFRAAFESGKPVNKKKLIEDIIAKGVTAGTAASYVVWAKRPVKDRIKNPFGFRIEESLNKAGEKVLTKK